MAARGPQPKSGKVVAIDMNGNFIFPGDRVISYNHIAPGENYHALKKSGRLGRGEFGFVGKAPRLGGPGFLKAWCVIADGNGRSPSYSGVYGPLVKKLY